MSVVLVVLVRARRNLALEYRGSGLLDLEEQRVVFVVAFEQHYVGAGAHAADSHDLPRRVHETVAVEQVAPILLQGALVALQDGVNLVPNLVALGDADQERRVLVYDAASIGDPG